MANSRVFFSNLKSGKCSSVVEVRLLRFWEARNVKRCGELMWLDMLMVDVNVRATAYNFTNNHKTFTITRIVDELGRVPDDDVDDNVRGDDGDDDNMPYGKPTPAEYESGGATGNASPDAKMGPVGTARKKTEDSSSKVVKKARVA
ncbi:hypothetical protein Bca52824_017759 [Brassica carinata]|uniref:DUF223 domain-containing protein n=1 Tax=Brassica carinata TaxID=52824 RepID=A0A8X8AYN7_BRACI|nr:hypothetical protein Bca52824_017759 [Brassica carinata]